MDDQIRTPADLARAKLIDDQILDDVVAVAARYAVAITPAMAELIDPTDPADPIARQFVPDPRELTTTPEENADPIGDRRWTPVEGVVHRYPDRVLLKVVHVCPVYCRFCFRREMVGPDGDGGLTGKKLDQAISYVASHPEIFEVILTGGDPFMLSPRRAGELTERLAAIGHVKVLRWHTRVPIADPARVTGELVQALRRSGKAVFVAVHANHARELTLAAGAAIGRLVDAGIPVLSQTVLLKGVNDDPATLEALLRGLVSLRVKPYYLHHADLAPGTSHWRTTIADGQRIARALRGRLSGLCQPTYVIDIPGGYGKVPVGPSYAQRAADADDGCEATIVDSAGQVHRYLPR